MKEWLQKLREQLTGLWSKWTTVQKVLFVAIVGAAAIGLVTLITVSAAPARVPVLTRPVEEPEQLDRITQRLDAESIPFTVGPDDVIYAEDQQTARRARAVLVREDLIPERTDPWEIFDVERWTDTDFERDVNFRRALTQSVEQHISALRDVDWARVNLAIPDDALFTEEQDPVTASVIISPRPGSDLREDRRRIEGIERLVMLAVDGLERDNITINDPSGVVLNEFDRLTAFDEVDLRRRELELERNLERQYIQTIRSALSGVWGEDRVRVANIDVDLDHGKYDREIEEFSPIEIRPDDPRTPFDDSEHVLNIPRSTRDFIEEFEGTGFNPEGPPGQEGQTPPEYLDRAGVVGRYSRSEQEQNFELNRTVTTEKGAPRVARISVGVALDGRWQREYDEEGRLVRQPDGSISREYIPVSEDELERAEELVQAAVGYQEERGDSVRVQHIQFDRTAQFEREDEEFRRREQIQQIVLYSLLGVASLLVIFIIFRLVSRELERRRRQREEELARQHQAMREAALRSAEEEGTEVEMSVEERARMEMQESAVNMAREQPEEVAQLIRTWLSEE